MDGNSEVPSVHIPSETPMPICVAAMDLAGTTNSSCGDLCAAMITEVRKHQALYDPECKAYYDTHMKESLWLTIASQLDIDVDTCRKKWRNLRDQFFKKRKKLKTANRKTAARIRMWRYMESMEFLVPYMAYRVTENHVNQSHDDGGWQETQDPSLSMDVAAVTSENGEVSAEADGHSEMGMASRPTRRSKASARARLAVFSERADGASCPDGPPSTSDGGTLRRKRKCKTNDDDDEEDRASTQDYITRRQRQQRSILELDPSPQSHILVAKDEDEHFMLSCIPTLKKLSPYRKMELRCKIQQLLLEYTSNDDV